LARARATARGRGQRGGGTAPSIYRHFPDKRHLLRAVVEERFRRFDRLLEQAETGATSPFDVLKRRCRACLRFAREQPGHYRVLFSATALGPGGVGTYGNGPHPGAALFFALVDAVQRCLDAGARSDRDAFFLAVQLWTSLHGMVDLRISKPEMPWPSAEAQLEAALSDLGLTRPAT
jgi:AcrR family transcriptional regulator